MIKRRSLVFTGLAGLAASAGAAVPASGVSVPASGAAAASPALSSGDVFDLSVASVKWIREKTLHNVTVMQSFAFDEVNNCMFAVQLMQGGIQLTGESAPLTGTQRAAHGDMCVTKLNMNGDVLGHMYLRGFGHGVSIGVEPVGTTSYLWTEADVNPASGYGRAVARFPYAAGKVLDSTSSSVPKLYVEPGSTANRPSVDMRSGRLLVEYSVSGAVRYRALSLAAAKSGDVQPLYDIPRLGVASSETFQGLALLGDYVYQMTGTAYTDESGSNPPSGHGNTYVSRLHLPTGTLEQRSRTEAAYSLDYREPEGLAIRLGVSPARLCMGFASGVAGARKYSIYYKPQS